MGPWCKVGGLADVVGALPPALAARGHEVLTVVPRYAPYEGVEAAGISVPLDLPQPSLELQADVLQQLAVPPGVPEGAEAPGGVAAPAAAATPSPTSPPSVPCSTATAGQPSSGDGQPVAVGRCAGQQMLDGQEDGPGESVEPAAASRAAQRLAQTAELYHCWQGGVHRVFVDHPLFHSSDVYGSTAGGGKGVYTYLEAGEAADLDLRYSVLCQAALAAPVLLERQAAEAADGSAGGSGGGAAQPAWQAGEQQRIVYVANDWPTALLLLRLQYSVRALGAAVDQGQPAPSSSSSTVLDVGSLQRMLAQRLGASAAAAFCIHNLAYQGVLGADTFARLGLPSAALPALCNSSDWRDVLHQLEQGCRGGSDPLDAQLQPAGEQQACPAPGTAVEAAAAGAATTAIEPAVDAAAACSGGELNQMRSALLAADCLVTVSPGYAMEVQQEGPFGCGLHDILAARGISGIMNGVDTTEWDPAADSWLPEAGRYTAATVTHGKAQMKAWLQERLGLAVDPATSLIGFVGRLTMQKGVDVLLGAAPALLAGSTPPLAPSRWRPAMVEAGAAAEGAATPPCPGPLGQEGSCIGCTDTASAPPNLSTSNRAGVCPPADSSLRQPAASQMGVSNAAQSSQLAVPAVQLVLLGTGEPWMESALLGLSQSFPRSAAGLTTFSEELAHWIMAAADFVIVPSRFEPCGLVAQAGVRYGAVPIVCAVGGLKDLVTPEVGYTLPGFSHAGTAADHRQNVQQLVAMVRQAAAEYGTPGYRAMQQHCMALDVSWEHPAAEWEQLLQRVASQHPPARMQSHEPGRGSRYL